MRQATIRTHHEEPSTVAAAVAPDNTDEMRTSVDGTVVETRIKRRTTGGLRTSIDDYLLNLDVADRTSEHSKTDTHTSTNDTQTRQ